MTMSHSITAIHFLALGVCGSAASGRGELLPGAPVTARGISAATFRLDGLDCQDARFELQYATDGREYTPCLAGLPRGERLLHSLGGKNGDLIIVFPLCMIFEEHEFIFNAPGKYNLRLIAKGANVECSLVEVEGSVTIKDATSSDLRFIESIGSREFWLSALGYDVIDSLALDAISRKSRDAETQHRASIILGIMMTATEAEEPHDARLAVKPWERSQPLGNALWSLAQNNEASSYAPYAAYFSGSVYLARFLEEFGKKDVNAMRESVIHDSHYEQAEAALSFAAERSDIYLKPKAMLFLAVLKAIVGDKDGFDRTIQRSIDAVPGEGVQKRQIEDVRKEITDWFAKSK